MKESVLVTGATGFLGGYLVDDLKKRNYRVIAVGRNEERGKELVDDDVLFYSLDFTDKDKLKDLFDREHIDYVIHAGAISSAWGEYEQFYNSNVTATFEIGKLCTKYHVKRMVYISSPSIYAAKEHKYDIAEDEFDEHNHLNYYIMTKIRAERVLHKWMERGLDCAIIRPRGLIGIGDPSLMPRMMRANSKIGIPLFHKGKNLVDITCVQNVAYACYLAMITPEAQGETFNITNGEPQEFKRLLMMFCEAAGKKPKFLELPFNVVYSIASALEIIYKALPTNAEPILTRYTVATLGFSQTLNIDKAKKILKYEPIISLEEGIAEYGEWWKANK